MDERFWRFPASAANNEKRDSSKFKSARRILRILDLVSQREGLSAKLLARELGVSLSTCYFLVNILIEEGYLEKMPKRRGYRIGPTIPLLYKRTSNTSIESTVGPVVKELAQRSERHAYLAVIEDHATEVTQVKSPLKSPPVGIVKGFYGASHALALGKVLMAHNEGEMVEDYIRSHGLEAFTPRTITQPAALKAQLDKVRSLGYATDIEEFAENLCCIAVPIEGKTRLARGAIGISTTPKHFRSEGKELLRLAQRAAKEASALLESE